MRRLHYPDVDPPIILIERALFWLVIAAIGALWPEEINMRRREFITLLGGAAWLSTISRLAWAQAYPMRPVRVIVPYAPGGPTDIFGRLIAQSLSKHLGKQFYGREHRRCWRQRRYGSGGKGST